MATKDKDGKLTYQMTSPGEALNNFVNSKEGHNAAAVTPAYLDSSNQNSQRKDVKEAEQKKPDLYYKAMQAGQDKQKESKEKSKDVNVEKDV